MSIGYCSDCDTEYGHRADCPRTKPSYTHLQQQLTDCKKQNVMLREALNEIAEGDGRATKKLDKCAHGLYGYEMCEECICDYARAALAAIEGEK